MVLRIGIMLLMLCAAAGCGRPAGPPAAYSPVNPGAAVFWDRQVTETAGALTAIIEEFNAARPGQLPIKLEYTGGYTEIYRKVSASIQARELPAMAVAYPSMTAEYIAANAVIALDPLVEDSVAGLSPEDRQDFFPGIIEDNRFAAAGNKLYSFPFCKSVLMLFVNKAVLAKAGIAEPPRTWDEFLQQCRQVKQATGNYAYALHVDPSTFVGWVYSMGGEVVENGKSLFDSGGALKAFELLETLAREDLLYQIPPQTFDDQAAFVQDKIAFLIRTSSARNGFALMMADRPDQWRMIPIPQANPAAPATVLFGPNVSVFNTTPEQQQAAWAFIKYFTSPAVSAKWATQTGYVPIRKSVAADPAIQQFWAQWPDNRAAYDCLPFARSEPHVNGWQELRTLIENAMTEVVTRLKTGHEAASALKQKADLILTRR